MEEQYGFYINTDRCVQCHACELACKSWNSVEPGLKWRRVIDAWSGEFPEVSNCTISYSCMHCGKPACVEACPEKAIFKRVEDGIVVVDPARCAGCRTCAAVCPFHIPQYGRNGIMQKCNMCLERLDQRKQPVCVLSCPGEALRFDTVENLSEVCRGKAAQRLASAAQPAFFISGRMTGAVFLRLLNPAVDP